MTLRGAWAGACVLLVAVAACGGGGDSPAGGRGGAASSSSDGSGAGGSGGTSVGGSSGTSSSATTHGGTGGGGAPATMGPRMVIPSVITLPYTVAGQGGSSTQVTITNDGDAPFTGLAFQLAGDPSLTLGAAPGALGPGASAQLTFSYAGAAAERNVAAKLSITSSVGALDVPVFAVTGPAGLGPAAWEDVIGPGGVITGTGATVDLPAAPFPDASGAWTDPSVRVFLPEGYRDRGAQDVIVHFHGWSTTLGSTLAGHLYQEHLWASGANAVLVVPQGPVSAKSGNFGKLMKAGGMTRLVGEVLAVLYREGKIHSPTLGELVLTSHSGGYSAVATNLQPAAQAPAVDQVDLYDSLYGYESTFEGFALGSGTLRSNYTQGGGTVAGNQAVATYLQQHGLTVGTAATQRALRDTPAVIDFAASSHEESTRLQGAYGERLRWALPHARRGPRVELREAVLEGGQATVRWLAPPDEDTTGFAVETSPDGKTWSVAADVGPSVGEAKIALGAGLRVRVRARVTGVDDDAVLRSDTYRLDPQPEVLVVDGFDRVLDGSFGGLSHDFAALIGEAAGGVATVSHRAITEDGFELGSWPAVIWLMGDQSTLDLSLSAAEQQALRAYVDGGGRLLVSGSELAWDIGQTTAGAAFLDHCFGAKYVSDSSGSHAVAGSGALASLSPAGFAGAGAPYACPYPDVLGPSPSGGGTSVLHYGNGKVAAVGIAGRAALVGFPLELLDASARTAYVQALLAFLG